jgi:PAS domain S-box-containing protein
MTTILAIEAGDLRPWLAAAFCIAAIAISAAILVLREHLLLERHARLQDSEIERLQDRLFETADSETRYRNLIEAQGDLIARLDGVGRIAYANEAYQALLGGTAPQYDLQPVKVLSSSEPRMRADGARIIDEWVETPHGARWISWIETQVRTGRGTPEVLRVGRDVTERVDAERLLEESRRKAETANRAKSRFLATVSHEIRTPLNGILGMTDLLTDTGLNPEQRTYVSAVRSSGEALLALINEILDFSKIEAGHIDITSEPFDLHALVEGVVELLAPRAQGKGIEIAASIGQGVPRTVLGDGERLRQVLINLAGNAVKFTDKGGVGLEVSRGTAGKLVFAVSDTGPGIARESLQSIFDEFERADGSLSSRHEGAGLGLAISKRIVDRMQGVINVESELGRGSAFRVTLPLPDTDRDMSAFEQRPDLTGRRILIVSRSPFEAPFLAMRLDEAGASVERVASIVSAEKRLASGHYAIVIADRALGETATQRLSHAARKNGVGRSLVLLSPFERRDFGSPAAAGFDGFLVKPVRPRSLFARLEDGNVADAVMAKPNTSSTAFAALSAFAAPSQSRRAAAARRKAGGKPSQVNVLLAEDNDINALLVRRLVEKCGARSDWACDGHQALKLEADAASGKRHGYGLALIDVRMPGMDGLAVARKIRQRERERGTERLTLVALTANAFPEDRDAAMAAGFDAFMPKPLDPDQLAHLLQQAHKRQQKSA